MSIYNRLTFLALGGTREYQHRCGKENKQTTKLQDFLSVYMEESKKEKAGE